MDLGTANTRIYRQGVGLVLNEPSWAALETETRRVLAVGREAKSCLGRTPRGMEVIRPLKGGGDFAAGREMIRRFLARAGVSRRLFRPKLVAGAPDWLTPPGRRAIIEAAEEAGCREVRLADESLAAAMGLDIAGRMILDVGGAVSVIALPGAFSEPFPLGGDAATEAVARYLRREYSLDVGENTAEQVKMAVGAPGKIQCRGKDAATGLPKSAELDPSGLGEALEEVTRELAGLVGRLMCRLPPESAELHLTGGGSLMAGLREALARDTGLKVEVPEHPFLSVVSGLGRMLENLPRYRRFLQND